MKTVQISSRRLDQTPLKENSNYAILKGIVIAIIGFVVVMNIFNTLLNHPEIETILFYINRLAAFALVAILSITVLVKFIFFGFWFKEKSNDDSWKDRMIEIEEL